MVDKQNPCEVSQVDRELYLALDIFHTCGDRMILAGLADDSPEMQSIARHRLSALAEAQERIAALEEALKPFARTDVLEPNGVILGLERWHFDRARRVLSTKEDQHG